MKLLLSLFLSVALFADDRVQKIESYFQKHNSPVAQHAALFVEVADTEGLDYALLPALAMVESTGGKHYIRGTNNFMGYGSGRIPFPSGTDCIKKVAFVLSYGDAYRNKSVRKKLRTWNPNDRYVEKVLRVMRQISSQR